ncbi:Cytochrome Oxidase Assembly subunit [Trichostrongylus colubriformis]|uniref:Cytochrome c oxidase assembly factor 3 n=1 Tax=Trichostrongylus colubriformis TaxID=6319 RepID=A0AAN8F6H3_TRICO
MLCRAAVRVRSVLLRQAQRVRYRSTAPTTTASDVQTRKDDDMLETIDIEDLPRAQKRFAKQFEKVNQERIKELFAKNYKNHVAMAVLLCLVVGIYYYTIHAVKQETFLEEIDEEMAAERPQTHGHLRPVQKS